MIKPNLRLGFIFFSSLISEWRSRRTYLYMTDDVQKEEERNSHEALKNIRGLGNFCNLFVCATKGKKDGIQIPSMSEVAVKVFVMNELELLQKIQGDQ